LPPAALPERWPQVCRVKIMFELLLTICFVLPRQDHVGNKSIENAGSFGTKPNPALMSLQANPFFQKKTRPKERRKEERPGPDSRDASGWYG